jgi:hypothetical protein
MLSTACARFWTSILLIFVSRYGSTEASPELHSSRDVETNDGLPWSAAHNHTTTTTTTTTTTITALRRVPLRRRKLLASRCSTEPDAEALFIVGLSHSGTTLMLRELGKHPDVWAVPLETGAFNRAKKTGLWNKTLSETRIARIQKGCLMTNKRLWVEKTPKHLFQLDRIFERFPKAKVVVMIRDPRETALSLMERSPGTSSKLRYSVSGWKTTMHALEKHPNILPVKYEDLAGNCLPTMNEIIKSLGFDLDEKNGHCTAENPFSKDENNPGVKGVKNQWKTSIANKPEGKFGKKNHEALRAWQMQQPVKLQAPKWPDRLSTCAKYTIQTNVDAQKLIKRMGYEPDPTIITDEQKAQCEAEQQ